MSLVACLPCCEVLAVLAGNVIGDRDLLGKGGLVQGEGAQQGLVHVGVPAAENIVSHPLPQPRSALDQGGREGRWKERGMEEKEEALTSLPCASPQTRTSC